MKLKDTVLLMVVGLFGIQQVQEKTLTSFKAARLATSLDFIDKVFL